MRSKCCWICLCILLLLWPTAAGAEDRALLIGVGDYQVTGKDLPGIEEDLSAMEEVCRLLGFVRIMRLKDSAATCDAVKQAMSSFLVDGVGPKDRVLFYFSGHGSQIADRNGDEEDGKDEVLLPCDVSPHDATLSKVLIDDDFGKMLAAIPAGMVLVMIDSCHSGTATKGFRGVTWQEVGENSGMFYKFFYYPGMPEGTAKDGFAKEVDKGSGNYVSLSAARDDEKAIATPRGSVFSQGILNAVKKAHYAHEPLCMTDLEKKTGEFIAESLHKEDRIQHPQLFGNQSLAKVNLFKDAVETVTPEPAPPAAVTADTLWNRLEDMADKAGYPVDVSINQDLFKVGDLLKITCRAPKTGYLNVLNLDPEDGNVIVLYPNKHHPDNLVQAGETVTIPSEGDAFRLRAKGAARQTMIMVFHSERKINAFSDGYGRNEDLFRMLSDKSMFTYQVERGFSAKPTQEVKAYGAGKVITVIEP